MPLMVKGAGGSIIGSRASGMFFSVELPPSVYYGQAAQWVTVNSNQLPNSTHLTKSICVNGALYIFFGSKIYTASLQTGVISDPGFPNINTYVGYSQSSICTDGKRFIWVALYGTLTLLEIDVITKTITTISSGFATDQYSTRGAIAYSEKHNSIYRFGEIVSTNDTSSNFVAVYDKKTNTVLNKTSFSGGRIQAGTYAFVDEANDSIYMGMVRASGVPDILFRYNVTANTLTNCGRTPSAYNGLDRWSSVLLGDTMLGFNGAQAVCFNPKNGASIAGQLPGPSSTSNRDQVGVWGNTLYSYVNGQGVKKCVFYQNLPADAPIVCKIYKGQKYHSTEPFEIPNKLSVTRQQKTATQDIEIKMYEYSAEGGQVIYIET